MGGRASGLGTAAERAMLEPDPLRALAEACSAGLGSEGLHAHLAER
jgi:hypothetical protein